MKKEYRIDPELNKVMPELSHDDYKELEQSLLLDGYKGAPIMIWGDIIVDGHNRYEICKRNDIPFEVKEVEFENKDEAIQWMVRQQLGRRNLNALQRIEIVETYRSIYEKQARKNQLSGLKQNQKPVSQNSSERTEPKVKIDVREECAKDAKVSTDTYSKGLKILKSDNQNLIKEVESGKKSIHKACKELKESQKKEETALVEPVINEREENQKENNPGSSEEINDNKKTLLQIQEHYNEYLTVFQNEIKWLMDREYIKRDEDITGKIHSDLRNCYEKFKSIRALMENMKIDEFDNNTIEVGK